MLPEAVDDEGVVVEDDELLLFDDVEPEPLFDDGARSRLKMHLIALDSPSPMVER
jgi:hypothetical protein